MVRIPIPIAWIPALIVFLIPYGILYGLVWYAADKHGSGYVLMHPVLRYLNSNLNKFILTILFWVFLGLLAPVIFRPS